MVHLLASRDVNSPGLGFFGGLRLSVYGGSGIAEDATFVI